MASTANLQALSILKTPLPILGHGSCTCLEPNWKHSHGVVKLGRFSRSAPSQNDTATRRQDPWASARQIQCPTLRNKLLKLAESSRLRRSLGPSLWRGWLWFIFLHTGRAKTVPGKLKPWGKVLRGEPSFSWPAAPEVRSSAPDTTNGAPSTCCRASRRQGKGGDFGRPDSPSPCRRDARQHVRLRLRQAPPRCVLSHRLRSRLGEL